MRASCFQNAGIDTMKESYDTIIVGAGIGGLVSAVLLSGSGRRVLVIEKEPRAGGYLAPFEKDGFLFEPSLHLLNGCRQGRYVYDMLGRCGILDRIDFVRPKYLYRSIYPDLDLRVPQADPDGYRRLLAGLFPASREGIDRFFSDAGAMFEEVMVLEKKKAMTTKLLPYFRETFGESIGGYIRDERLKAVIAQPWTYFGLPPSLLRSIDFYYPWYDYVRNGGAFVKGGSRTLIDALVSVARKNGAAFLFETRIDRIIIEEGRCTGVVAGAKKFSCERVVSNADLSLTVNDLIGTGAFPPAAIKQFGAIEPSISNFEIFLGLDTDLRPAYPDEYEIFVNAVYDCERQYELSLQNRADLATFTVTLYSAMDRSIAPVGKSVVTINMLAGYDFWQGLSRSAYEKKKAEIADILLGRACKVVPELRTAVRTKVVSTPTTFKRYTNNGRGSIYGYVRSAGGGREIRPNTAARIKDLYFASAWARQGSGVEKVLRSAGEVAEKVLSAR